MKYALSAAKVHRHWPPNGGWKYRQPETGWESPGGPTLNFKETVDLILKHRKANKGHGLNTNVAAIEADLMDQVARRIIEKAPTAVSDWVVPLDEEAKKKSPGDSQGKQQPGQAPAIARPAAGVLERILTRVRGLANGVATLADWVGQGATPVAQAVAERRARTCVACPKNKPGSGVVDAIADAIRSQTVIKNSLGLSTAVEDRLQTCAACACNLRLKVWVPLETVKAHTSPAVEADLDPTCWIRHERTGQSTGTLTRAVPIRKTLTIQRKAAFGDAILATLVCDRLVELGVASKFATEPVIQKALVGHPSITEFVDLGSPDVNLDGAYEGNLERTRKDIGLLMLEAANHDLRKHGVAIKDMVNRVPNLYLTDDEQWKALTELQAIPRPWVVVVDGSGSWPNRQWDRREIEQLPRLLDASLIWTKHHRWSPAPPGFAPLEITSFRHLMAVISQCDLVVTPDTGPIHVAAAFNKPVVALEQCNDTHLRLTNLTDWTAVTAPFDCVRCGDMTCKLEADANRCQRIPAVTVADAIRKKLSSASNGRVSAIIPCLHWRPASRRALDQVVGQVDEVVIAIDGTMSDQAVPYQRVSFTKAPGIRTGYGKTNMRAARQSDGEFLLMLNDDCYLDPGAVAKMKEAMTDGVGVVGALLRYPDGRIQHGGCFRPPGAMGFGHLDWGKSSSRFTRPTEMEAVTFAAALVRRSAFFGVRGFDERFDCYGEDADCCMKLRQAGWRVVFQPAATGIHDESQTTGETKQTMLHTAGQTFASKWRHEMLTTKPMY